MPRRLLLTIIALGLTLTLSAAPVAAGGGSSAVGATSWVAGESLNGGAYASFPSCHTGQFDLGGIFLFEYRCAFEFDLPALPAGATITSATLSLRTSLGNGNCSGGACLIDIAGYVGNGTSEVADLTAGSNVLTFAAMTAQYEVHDVTAFVTGLYSAADDWAGFGLSRAAGSVPNDELAWEPPQFTFPPILTITYDLPNPPTPVASGLPDAAMNSSADSSPILATLGFALLLLGSLGTLAFATTRRR